MTRRDIIVVTVSVVSGAAAMAAIIGLLSLPGRAKPEPSVPIAPPSPPPVAAAIRPVAPRPAAPTVPVQELIRVDSQGKLKWSPVRKLPGAPPTEAWPVTSGLTVRWLIPEDSKVRKYIQYESTEDGAGVVTPWSKTPGDQTKWYTMAPCRLVVTGHSGRVYRRDKPIMRLWQTRKRHTGWRKPSRWNARGGSYNYLGPPEPLGFSIGASRPQYATEHAKLFYDTDAKAWDPATDKPVLIQFIVGDEFAFEWRDGDPETGR